MTAFGDVVLINQTEMDNYQFSTKLSKSRSFKNPLNAEEQFEKAVQLLFSKNGMYNLQSRADLDIINNEFLKVVNDYPINNYTDDALLMVARQYGYYSTNGGSNGFLITSYDSVIKAYQKVLDLSGQDSLSEFMDNYYGYGQLEGNTQMSISKFYGITKTKLLAKIEQAYYWGYLDFEKEKKLLREILIEYPNSKFSASIQFQLARSCNNRDELIQEYRKLIEIYKSEAYIPIAYQELAYASLDLPDKMNQYQKEISSRYTPEDYFSEGRKFRRNDALQTSFGLRWKDRIINIRALNLNQTNPTYRFKNIYLNAINEWNKILKKYGFALNNQEDPNAQTQVSVWFTDTSGIGPKKGMSGVAFIGYQDGGGRSGWLYWSSIFVDTAYSDEGVLNILVHEIGHAFGLGHSFVPQDIMYFSALSSKHGTLFTSRDIKTLDRIFDLPVMEASYPYNSLYGGERKIINLHFKYDETLNPNIDSAWVDFRQIQRSSKNILSNNVSLKIFEGSFNIVAPERIYSWLGYRPALIYVSKNKRGDSNYCIDQTSLFISPSPTNIFEERTIITNYSLSQNYPNPFNPSTNISYQIPASSYVTLEVYDILGRKITTLVHEEKNSGKYNIKFNANELSSGIYFYTLRTKDFIQTKKMILIR